MKIVDILVNSDDINRISRQFEENRSSSSESVGNSMRIDGIHANLREIRSGYESFSRNSTGFVGFCKEILEIPVYFVGNPREIIESHENVSEVDRNSKEFSKICRKFQGND